LLAAAEARFRLSGSRRSGRAQRHWPVRTPGGGYRIAIASYLGRGDSFGTSILDFSVAYADQTEQDYQALVIAVKSGRLPAQTGL
jgi:predicted alpha/beta hydrolase